MLDRSLLADVLTPVLTSAGNVVLQMKVVTPEECSRAIRNKTGAVAVDLFKQYYPEAIHLKHPHIKEYIRQLEATSFDGESGMQQALGAIQQNTLADASERECARRMSEYVSVAFKHLLPVLPGTNQAFPNAAAAKDYTWSRVKGCQAPKNLRAQHSEETNKDYEATRCEWLYGKIRNKVKIIGTQCLVDPMTVPMAARPMGSVATNFGVPDGGSGAASVASHGARNDAGAATTNGLANPIAAEAVIMIHVAATIPAGVKDPNTHVVQASPFLGARTPAGTAYKRPLDGASSSTSGSPKKHRMEQAREAAERTQTFRKLFEEYECRLAQQKSEVEFELTTLSGLEDGSVGWYQDYKQGLQHRLEELNDMTPGTFRFSASCN